MKWEIEVLSPSPYVLHNNNNSNYNTHWLLGDSNNFNNRSSTKWTPEENKLFENALALHDKDTPDRWQRVAEMIPGKTAFDVMNQYKELEADVSDIEAGLVPIPGYSIISTSTTTSTCTSASPFTLDWVTPNSCSAYDGFKSASARRNSSRPVEQERKKGVPWTEEEHKLFLLGLKKYGKGDWRNISRNFVITRTPTQVASHAQKYFIRQLSGGKDKRRASIHDITTANLTDNKTTTTTSDESKMSNSPPQHSMMFSNHQLPNSTTPIAQFQWSNNNNNNNEEIFMSSYGANNSYGFKMQGQNLHKSASFLGHHHQTQNLAFQMQSSQYYSHA